MISVLNILNAIPTEAATSSSAVDFTWLFVKMLLVLAIVSIFAVLLLKYAVPRFGFFKPFHQKGRYFTVLGRYALEPKKSLYLVNIGKRYLVIGTADHGISLITEISKEEAEGEE
jgi:flagellar biosynthetic protein FliO